MTFVAVIVVGYLASAVFVALQLRSAPWFEIDEPEEGGLASSAARGSGHDCTCRRCAVRRLRRGHRASSHRSRQRGARSAASHGPPVIRLAQTSR